MRGGGGGWGGGVSGGSLSGSGGLAAVFTNGADDVAPPPSLSLSLLLRILECARPYTYRVVCVFACIVVTSGLSMLPPIIVREIVDRVR